jgi:hypothetical protein
MSKEELPDIGPWVFLMLALGLIIALGFAFCCHR